jgi:hypothetical protein
VVLAAVYVWGLIAAYAEIWTASHSKAAGDFPEF